MILHRPLALLLISLAGAAGLPSANAADGFERNGWHTWRVAAVKDAPDWCCHDWNSGVSTRKSCNLDGRSIHYGSSNESSFNPGQMQFYALIEDGAFTRVRSLSPQCHVETNTEIHDLGVVAAELSISWLEPLITPHSDISAHVLAAIATHEGNSAREVLVGTAQDDSATENRKQAVFWMAQLRLADTSDEIRELMHSDRDPEIRQHAAFSYAQSKAPDRVEALIEIVEDPGLPREDRKQALFWIAQSDSEQGVDYLQRLLMR
jgi:hypothetical protein